MGVLSRLFAVGAILKAAPVVVLGRYTAGATTRADGDGGPLETDVNGVLKVVASGTPVAALSEYVDDGTGFVLGTGRITVTGGNVDDTATRTAAEGDVVSQRMSTRGAAAVFLDQDIRGENATTKRLDVSTPHSTARMTTATTTTHLTGAGRFRGVCVGKSVAAATELGYDNTAASGPVVYARTGPAVVSDVPPYACDVPLTTGFTVIQSGATDAMYNWNANP